MKNLLISFKADSKLKFLFLGTLLAMVPAYLLRYKDDVFMFFYNNFTTYPGDLWNFFYNYLQKGLVYPPEYPAGLRFFYEVMGFHSYESYTLFFTVNTLILLLFALGTTYLLYLLVKKRGYDLRRIWYFWILAPSFIFYGTINYDLPVVFLVVLSVYLFTKEKFYQAIFWLGLGMVLKVFPVFLLPIFIWKAPRELRVKLVLLFGLVVLACNLPYMINNFQTWLFPYVWQISSNISKGPDQGTYWWLIYPLAGKFTGWLSLGLFGALYLFTSFKMKKAHFFDLCLNVILLFLLTDRIYSPQYNLYLLPFVVLCTFSISRKKFYIMDILNLLIVFFCFFLKDNPAFLQIIVFARYFLLISILRQNYVHARE
jgi:hypothetical protein